MKGSSITIETELIGSSERSNLLEEAATLLYVIEIPSPFSGSVEATLPLQTGRQTSLKAGYL